jgi:hypothetical protein
VGPAHDADQRPGEYARRHNLKRGAGLQHVLLERVDVPLESTPNLVALDEALAALEHFDARKAKVGSCDSSAD